MSAPTVTRRSILMGSSAILLETVTASLYSERFRGPSVSSAESTEDPAEKDTVRDQWLKKAESLKPVLKEIHQTRYTLVKAVPDPNQYLRWRMEVDSEGAPIEERLLRKGDTLILDFGGHRTGHLEFKIAGVGNSVDAPAWIRFRFGEVPGDVAEDLYPYRGSLSSAWLPEDTMKIDFLPQQVRLPRRYAFRYVRIDVLDTSPNYAAHFSGLKAIALTSAPPLKQELPPHTAKWMLDVDAVSLATLRDCMQTTFEDGPRRDQRLWIGDLRLQARASYLTFPNPELVKRCLYLFAALSRESDGFLPACVFEKPSPATTGTFILDYAALYGAIVLDYARATGDTESARELWPVAKRQIDLLLANVNETGIFEIPQGEWAFIDWSTPLDRSAAMQGVVIYSCRRLVDLAHLIGRDSDIAQLSSLVAKMVHAGRARYYDAAAGVCVSGPERQVSWASQAWVVLAECLTHEESELALRKAILQTPNALRPNTPYLFHHVVEALLVTGMHTEALSLIKEYWGAMVEAGADTFWEAYDPKDSRYSPYGDVHINSFCHAWSCTPAYFFRTYGASCS